jgi:hypothetical protein
MPTIPANDAVLTMPASLRSIAGTIGARRSSSGTNC